MTSLLRITQDTANTILEHNMLAVHPWYTLGIALVVIALFLFVRSIRRRS